MNEKLMHKLRGQEAAYPKKLEAQFQRVFSRIVELWDTKEIDDYFNDLLMDTRGGTRQGFPPEVASEIFALSVAHEKICEQNLLALGNPWSDADLSTRTAIEQRSYAFTPKGFAQSAEKGDREAILLFLSSGVNIDTPDERGWTPLMISTFNGREEIALLLIQHGANVNARDSAGYGPLHWACFNGYDSVVELLIEKRAAVNATSQHGWSPLLQAASRGHLSVAERLIRAGADVNLASHDGWTPLHKAAANGHVGIARLLIAQGALRHPEYKDGTTPMMLARKNKHADIIALLAG